MKKQLIGAHISISGGFDKSIERAEKIGANCIQIFTKSNRQWKAKPITKEGSDKFKGELKKSTIYYVVAHASYLINLGSKSDETVEKSIVALSEEINRCEQLGIESLVIHPGTMRFNDRVKSLTFIADNLDQAISSSNKGIVKVLLETMAGQGKTVGNELEDLSIILKNSKNKDKLGVCFDSCHAFVAGHKFESESNYKNMWAKFDEIIGLSKLKLLHLNNSKKEFNSRVDRHDHIESGKISINAFNLILNDKNLLNIPKILETPSEDDSEKYDKKNIESLKKLIK